MECVCALCKEIVSDVYTLQISDEKSKVKFRGHLDCMKEINEKRKQIDKAGKMKLDQLVKKLGL